MKRVLIYGTGKVAEFILSDHIFTDETVVGVVETEKLQKMWGGGTRYIQ